jgi:hypothetical protein
MEKIFALASISNWHLLPQTELVIDHHKHTLILEEAIHCLLQESHLVASKHSGPTPVGAVNNIKRTACDDDDDMAHLVLGADTIKATSTGNKTPKEIRSCC